MVHAAEVVAVDSSRHIRGLLGAFGWERTDGRGGVVVLVMGLRIDGVHHSPREILKRNAEAIQVSSPRWCAHSSNKCQGGWRSLGSFNSINP